MKEEKFTLVDVGCSGGVEPTWRVFGDRFRAVGFDIRAEACGQLAAEETHGDVHYVAGSTFRPRIPLPKLRKASRSPSL